MRALVLAVAAISAAPANAQEFIRCTAPGKLDVDLALNAEHVGDRTVSCIDGDFTEHMTPCAPLGRYGRTEDAVPRVVRIVTDWYDERYRLGPFTRYTISPTEINFSGWYLNVYEKLKPLWRFSLHRTTGKAVLTLEKGSAYWLPRTLKKRQVESYVCRAAQRKF